MNCSIVNARPQNMSIDANGTYNNRAFKFTFYGDRTIGADFYIYDMNTNKLWNNVVYSDYAAANGKKYYYNGEEIDIHAGTNSGNNNKQYIWKTRVYDDIDISNGKNPTIRVVTGSVKPNPFIKGTIPIASSPQSIANEKYIYIEPVKEITLPSWITINNERRIILEYKYVDENTPTQLRLKNAFTTYPEKDAAYSISPYQTTSISKLDTNQLAIATKININGSDKDNRAANPFTIEVDYPTTPQPCYYLEIKNVFYPITSYSSNLGIVTLDTNVDVKNTISAGTPYTIYCSFVESPFFYFTTEPTPVIENLQLIQDGEVIKCSADLVAKSFVKYQYWEIYDVTDADNPIKMETSEKMFLGALEFVFRGGLVGHSYKAVLHVVTQTNWDITAESNILQLVTSLTGNNIFSLSSDVSKDNAIEISIVIDSGISKNGGIKVLRKSLNNDLITYITTVEFSKNQAARAKIVVKDYKAANDVQYKYYICCYNPTTTSNKATMYAAYETEWISANYNTYSVYSLQEIAYERYDVDTDKRIDYDYMYAERFFKITNVFRPEISVTEKHNINHNIGRDVYVGYAKKPVVSARETAYDTFSLSFQLGNTEFKPIDGVSGAEALELGMGYIDIVNNDIEYYKKLEKVILDAPPFLIKDYKGNVWFGSITTYNNEIDNSITNVKPITINIDFTETYPIDKIRIAGE